MVVVGPENPLVEGLADFLKDRFPRLMVIGPGRRGALLEGSKEFAKDFMLRHGIPTAAYRSFTKDTIGEAFAFLETLRPPYVLKADGLAAGKGVLIVDTLEQAQQQLRDMLGGMFGTASHTVVIEEFLHGIECSVFVLTDGNDYHVLPVAKDYKRVGEGDTGPNTGGMGSVSPVRFADAEFMAKVDQRIIRPTIEGLRAEGLRYRGFIFLGLMNAGGDPYVIEYNVRMGDPETQSVMPRIASDLVDLLEATAQGTLGSTTLDNDPLATATVILTSGGYPGHYEKGKAITGLDQVEGSIVFHAGTAINGDTLVTSGGRVLAVTSRGESVEEALATSYKNAARIHFDGCYYRHDIGFDLTNNA
jgi:phosphoribosylamine--glycine ligase